MDREGEIILPHSHTLQYLDGFHSGRALVMPRRFAPANSVYGYITLNGETIIPCTYTKAYSFRGEYAYVEDNSRAMFIDVDNKTYKQLPADNPKDTKYWLTNGDIYDGCARLLE